jgi:hypothetical protein
VEKDAGGNRQEATPGDAWRSLSPIPKTRTRASRAGFFMPSANIVFVMKIFCRASTLLAL